jgi:DNA replication protein DnaC
MAISKEHFTSNYFSLCNLVDYDDRIINELKKEPDFFLRNLILAHIPKKYWKYEWDHIRSDLGMNDYNHDGIEKVNAYLNNIDDMFQDGRGLYIYGGHGTSKTTTATIILRSVMDKMYTGYYLHFHDLIDFIASVWSDESKKWHWEYIVQKIDFLVLDDIARNFKMSEKESFVIDKLFVYRTNNNLPTILTTNLNTDDIGGLLGASILSIFKENVDEVKFVGEDVRAKCRK